MKFSVHILIHLDNKPHLLLLYTTTLWPGTTSLVTTLVNEFDFTIGNGYGFGVRVNKGM